MPKEGKTRFCADCTKKYCPCGGMSEEHQLLCCTVIEARLEAKEVTEQQMKSRPGDMPFELSRLQGWLKHRTN